jgi:hypothetical protein
MNKSINVLGVAKSSLFCKEKAYPDRNRKVRKVPFAQFVEPSRIILCLLSLPAIESSVQMDILPAILVG